MYTPSEYLAHVLKLGHMLHIPQAYSDMSSTIPSYANVLELRFR